ncbi:hypothetical protein HHI36_009030 [Cryptolaemus montrouzieri]|uniref:Uncharacterized protein n=1 Tax=Cryptolaemus montrouzieri TaxID=559131 RepID=A0ABD2MUZ2_9CUCU
MYMKENLITSVITNFIPSKDFYYNQESPYGRPILQAVKLVRVLCSRSKKLALEFIEKHSLIESISKYLQDEAFGVDVSGMKLQTECLHLWRTLLEYGLSLEQTSTLASILLKHLDYHFKHTSINSDTTYAREGHCAGVLILLGKLLVIKPSLISMFENLIRHSLSKWCQQFQRLEVFQCGKSQIISSLMFLAKVVYEYSKLSQFIDENFMNVIKSACFSHSIKNIQKCSMLLNNYEPQPFSANLKTLQCSAWYTADHVIPIMQTTSCLPFLNSLSEFLVNSGDYAIKLNFLKHQIIKEYIATLEKQEYHFLTSHWFTRIESQFILNILRMSVEVQKDIDTSVFYALAVKALCVFSSEHKKGVEFLFKKIIFCRSFYPSEALLKNLDLNEGTSLEVSFKNLDEIREVYSEILGIKMFFQTESIEDSFVLILE